MQDELLVPYQCESCLAPQSPSNILIPQEEFKAEQLEATPAAGSFDLVHSRYSSPIIQCGDQCGLIYRAKRPPEATILLQYNEEPLDPNYSDLWRNAWSPIYNRFLSEIKKRAQTSNGNTKILDMSSQLACFPHLARIRGFEAYGLDI